MLKYFITIVEANNTVGLFERDETTIETFVTKHLETWSNHIAMTSGANRHEKEFFQAGTTKDGLKAFSILAIWQGRVFKHIPKEITVDSDTKEQWASFGYYEGIDIAKELNLKQSLSLKSKEDFIVCCGDVCILVDETEFPEIKRRIL